MSRTLTDLHNSLMAQLERVGNEDLAPEELEAEIRRSHSMGVLAKPIIDNARLTLDVSRHFDDTLDAGRKRPKMLEAD